MTDQVDLLRIKIEKAKANLSQDTLNAISAVDWRGAVMKMREKKGYTFEQLGDLETETELLLCGLITPEEYPKELAKRMAISSKEVNELVEMMNDLAFKKIKEELIKNMERKDQSQNTAPIVPKAVEEPTEMVLDTVPDISIPTKTISIQPEELPKIPQAPVLPTKPAPSSTDKEEIHPILSAKLAGTVKMPTTSTEHSLDNITKTDAPTAYPPKSDPYREIPE